jgi:hypothetical protein
MDDYSTLKNYLEQNETPYYTFYPKAEERIKAVMPSAWRNPSRRYFQRTAGIWLQSTQRTTDDHHASAGTGRLSDTGPTALRCHTRAGREIATNLQAHTPEPLNHTSGRIPGPQRAHAML